MDNKSENNNPLDQNQDPQHDFFKKAEIPYSRSKADVWENVSTNAFETKNPKVRVLNRKVIGLGIAAAMILLIGFGGFLRFYTTTVEVPAGEHLAYVLPDGSRVDINALSSLSYKPYWWRFQRQVSLDGEAFFQVKKGNEFAVVSEKGITKVLGTSFNIYSRNNNYRVACITGKVEVISPGKESVILSPDYHAEIGPGGKIFVNKYENPEQVISWKDDMFNFTAAPIYDVFDELQRQYGIQIISDIDPRLTYTGFFSRDKHVEEVLGLLCKPFGFTFAKQAEGVYLVKEE